MDAYTVVLAGFVLFGGGLVDRFGRKGIFMTGLALFGVASLAGTTASEPWQVALMPRARPGDAGGEDGHPTST